MFQLYSILKSRPDGEITQEEIDVASGKRALTAKASAEFLGGLEAQSENIKNTFAKQQEQAGAWDQDRFEDLLTKWIVATDQPFDTVDNPEFRDLMGEHEIEATKTMFVELD